MGADRRSLAAAVGRRAAEGHGRSGGDPDHAGHRERHRARHRPSLPHAAGHAVNPAQIERQIAGSFVYGLSALFHGGITIKDGEVVEKNFDTYGSIRMSEMPRVESIIMPSNDFWGGVGEPTIFVAAPAVLNAFFAATGKRIRSIPLKNHNISFA